MVNHQLRHCRVGVHRYADPFSLRLQDREPSAVLIRRQTQESAIPAEIQPVPQNIGRIFRITVSGTSQSQKRSCRKTRLSLNCVLLREFLALRRLNHTADLLDDDSKIVVFLVLCVSSTAAGFYSTRCMDCTDCMNGDVRPCASVLYQ